ncbi:MAG: cytochrome c family protein [Rhodobacteraceae bacterium]|nr:cytochrome c family protein [Paracoccaceae bacterium]
MRFGIKSLALIAATTLMAPMAFADEVGNAEEGENVFKKCKACHKIGEGAENGTGPMLNDVMGRVAGTVPDFSYSDDLVAAGAAGLVWDADNMSAFIEDPKKFLRDYLDDKGAKSKMTLKVKKDEERADVIAYVATFSAPPAASQ